MCFEAFFNPIQLSGSRLIGLDVGVLCFYVWTMAVTIQIRNVPDTLRRRLKSRAALAGMSLSGYLLKEIRKVAERPSLEEMRDRLQRRSSVALSTPAAELVRAERERR